VLACKLHKGTSADARDRAGYGSALHHEKTSCRVLEDGGGRNARVRWERGRLRGIDRSFRLGRMTDIIT